jgi:hypothetical protein
VGTRIVIEGSQALEAGVLRHLNMSGMLGIECAEKLDRKSGYGKTYSYICYSVLAITLCASALPDFVLLFLLRSPLGCESSWDWGAGSDVDLCSIGYVGGKICAD